MRRQHAVIGFSGRRVFAVALLAIGCGATATAVCAEPQQRDRPVTLASDGAAPTILPVGMRTAAAAEEPPKRVEVRGEWFYVDGEPFLVKGVGYSPYRPGQLPWRDRVDAAVMERDFQRIAAAGFNTLRTWSPLPSEALTLAERHGLMVLQGIWVERSSNYASEAFRETMLQVVSKEAERAKGHHNVLALLVGNELIPGSVQQAGIPEIEALLGRASDAVKQIDPNRLVSYANWPALFFLNTSKWDAVCFNLYPYEPSSVEFTFGFRSYVEHVKRTVARGRPFIVTETGLSVSPTPGNKPGYGGLSPQIQAQQLLALWDDIFQGGAQGGVVFEWNDEWWKHAESADDADTHEADEPEEWFGLMEFTSKTDVEGHPRPSYHALSRYNQAILLSPVSGERYRDRVPVTVYATERVSQLRVQLDQQKKWHDLAKLDRRWWKTIVPLGPKDKPGAHTLTLEAYDAQHRLLVRQSRGIVFGPAQDTVKLSIGTDRTHYETSDTLEPVRYTMTVTDGEGKPLANRQVFWSVSEPQSDTDLTQTKTTDANGRVEGTYLVHERGLVTLSAAASSDASAPHRRVGDETFLIVRQLPKLIHQPSIWETNLSPELSAALRHDKPAFQLSDPGTERIVNYERYGTFVDVGTAHYHYEVTDWQGLAAAAGEGVYPNEGGLLKDPAYKQAKASGKLEGSHWDFTFLDDKQLSFFKWAGSEEEVGVKQFYTALTLERAGLLAQAVKAYYAVIVHFPTSIGWTAFNPPTPWYVGKVAADKIDAIVRLHPELGMQLAGARIDVQNGFDNDADNDSIVTTPGTLMSVAPDQINPPSIDVAKLAKKRELGHGRVRLVQYENGHWQLLVNNTPWVVRGLTYAPSAVGETPDEGTSRDWMTADRNTNGTLDVFETFVDANRNDRRDPDEPVMGDFKLIQDLGANTLRLFHSNHNPKTAKPLLRKLYEQYGFMVAMGDFVGMYTIGSGAAWEEGTDYLDKTQRKRMFESVKAMVREYKQEPYLLFWVLGNENNYGGVHGIVGGVGNAGKHPDAYYSFLNELATWIHAEDPNHPVAVGNGEWLFLDTIASRAPAIDIFGANVYRGWHGFGRSLFGAAQQWLDKPVLITEYGCPAYQLNKPREIAERDQALYHFGNLVDLTDNMAGRGLGNAIGGMEFEWSDEWWKGGQPPRFSPRVQETGFNWHGPFPGGHMFEEWLGMTGQGDGALSPYLRQLRPAYWLYQRFWSASNAILHLPPPPPMTEASRVPKKKHRSSR